MPDSPPAEGPDRARPDRRPVLDQINLVVRDMDAMIAFYTTIGVDFPPAPEPWTQNHRSASGLPGLDFDLDSTGFAQQWNEGRSAGTTGPVIGFRFGSRAAVDDTFADLIAVGYTGQQAPYDAFWGARYAVVLDPEGNSVGLMSEVDAARRTTPPTPPAPSAR